MLNYLLNGGSRWLFGQPMSPIPWLVSEDWSKPSLAILAIWRWTGYTMVLMLAGLQSIPQDCYEAARLDGASPWQQLWSITIPLMRPVITFCGITSLLGSVYMFDEIVVLTKGGPGMSSTNLGLYLFQTSFVDFRFGYASAVGYVAASIMFLLTLIHLRTQGATRQ
jgi:ABC-type sugar transport system permease subunit